MTEWKFWLIICIILENLIVFGSSWSMKLHLKTNKQVEFVKNLQNDQVLLSTLPLVNKALYMTAEKQDLQTIIKLLISEDITYSFIDRYTSKEESKRNVYEEGKERFLSIKEISNWILSLPSKYKSFIEIQVIGESFNKQNIYALKVGKGKNLPSALFESGTHAREWLASASIIGAVNNILEDFHINNNSIWSNILMKWNIYFIPMLNPDGYAYSMENSDARMWRKNRQHDESMECTGIDINRNFPVGFKENNDSCDQVFPGKVSFSTPEASAFRDFVLSILKNLKVFVSFHNYAQKILLPWAYKNEKPENYDEIKDLGMEIAKNILKIRNTSFEVGTPPELMYMAGGTSFDWVKSIGVPYSFNIELSPEDDSLMGFIVPEEEIQWSIKEVMTILETIFLKKYKN